MPAGSRMVMRRVCRGLLTNRHFWGVVLLFVVFGIILAYPRQLRLADSPSLLAFLGLMGNTFERLMLLVPISYAAAVFGQKGALLSLGVAAGLMLPGALTLSEHRPDAIFESVAVLVLGAAGSFWIGRYQKERKYHQTALAGLESSYRELRERSEALERQEERLTALNRVAATLSQSLELSQMLDRTAETVTHLLHSDGTWIYLLETGEDLLTLSAHRGLSETLPSVKVGYGFSGRVAETGRVSIVHAPEKDAFARRSGKTQMESLLIVPIQCKGQLIGTLGISYAVHHEFEQSELELLSSIADQLGMAIENARLYKKEQEAVWKLRASEQRYRALFENAHDAIWVHDLNGNVVTANAATEALTGYSLGELLTMNVRSLLDKESLSIAGQVRAKLLVGDKIEQPYGQRLIRKDGSQAFLKLTTNILHEDGRPAGFLHIARDVTAEKKMQDTLSQAYRDLTESHKLLQESQEQLVQAEKLSSLGQLAASIAHEINNPLSGILAYDRLLIRKMRDGTMTAQVAIEYLGKMERELVRSTKLVRNLLDFARQSPPAFRSVNLNEVMERAADLVSSSVPMAHIKVVTDFNAGLPAVNADFDQLEQVCTNLILNAVQAMGDGGTLTLRTLVRGQHAVMQIEDTGCGIPSENMHKLFTPFFSTKKEVKGVGLGLAVSYGIVQNHHGRIEVDSQPGAGTTMSVLLPLAGAGDTPMDSTPTLSNEPMGVRRHEDREGSSVDTRG